MLGVGVQMRGSRNPPPRWLTTPPGSPYVKSLYSLSFLLFFPVPPHRGGRLETESRGDFIDGRKQKRSTIRFHLIRHEALQARIQLRSVALSPHLTLQFTQLSNSMMHACLGSGCRWEAPGIRCHDRQLPRQDPRMSSLSIPFPFSSLSLLASAFQTLGGQGLSLTLLLSFLFASLINYYYTRWWHIINYNAIKNNGIIPHNYANHRTSMSRVRTHWLYN